MNIFTISLLASVVIIYYLIPLAAVYVISKLFHIKSKRPYLITALCINLIITILLLLPKIASSLQNTSLQFLIFNLLLHLALTIVSLIGLWGMKKWSIYALLAQIIAALIFPVQTSSWSFFSLVALLPVIIALFYYKKFK